MGINEPQWTDPAAWSKYMTETNEAYLTALDRNVEAQRKFAESWFDVIENSTETAEESFEGYGRAYEVWMEAFEEQFEKVSDLFEGEDVSPTEFRDIWLSAANEAFQEAMSTSAFAAATGQSVEEAMAVRRQLDEATESTLHSIGFPTKADIEEVGSRLVEIERRQHEVERQLGRILETLER